MFNAKKIDVTFPCGETRRFSSVRAVARMLSGYGTESGGFRTTISEAAENGAYAGAYGDGNNVVRNNKLAAVI